MTLFKPRVDKVIFALTTGGLCVIIPSFLDRQFLVTNHFHQLAHVLDDSFVDNHFHRYGASASYLPAGYPYDFRARGYGARLVDDEC